MRDCRATENGTLIAKAWTNDGKMWECNKLKNDGLTNMHGTKEEVLAYCAA